MEGARSSVLAGSRLSTPNHRAAPEDVNKFETPALGI